MTDSDFSEDYPEEERRRRFIAGEDSEPIEKHVGYDPLRMYR